MAKLEKNPEVTEENANLTEGNEDSGLQEVANDSGDSAATTEKRSRKLAKEINFESGVVTIEVVGGKEGKLNFDFNALPDSIKANLGPFGLGHKLGDAASGKSGEEAEEAIIKVFEGLMKADWSVRAPAAPKLTKNEISERLAKLDPESRAAAIAGLAALGIEVKI